jgi:hypothetical protein
MQVTSPSNSASGSPDIRTVTAAPSGARSSSAALPRQVANASSHWVGAASLAATRTDTSRRISSSGSWLPSTETSTAATPREVMLWFIAAVMAGVPCAGRKALAAP